MSAEVEDARSGRQPSPGHDLPAPYQDPMAALAHDLQAVLATLRLRLQELWRRNRQGDLSVPGFWPHDLAPLFWPLLLALVLAALGALSIGVGRWPPEPPQSAPELLELPGTSALPEVRPTAEPEPVAEAEPIAEAEPTGEAEPTAEPQPVEGIPPPLELDPLLELLRDDDPQQLILSVHPEPGAGLLQLQLAEAFAQLPLAARSAASDRWLERSQALGYERLELLDGAGRLLGRQALVGSGMILLELAPPR